MRISDWSSDVCSSDLFDTVRSFPVVIFGLATVTVVGPSLATILFIVVVTSIPTFGRVARTQTMAIRNDEFIVAATAMGAGAPRIVAVHILPNIIGPLLILASMDIPVVITIEAGLSFLGVGVPPPAPSWGSILSDGFSYIRNTPWRSEEHTSELQSLMRISYAVFCLKKKKKTTK